MVDAITELNHKAQELVDKVYNGTHVIEMLHCDVSELTHEGETKYAPTVYLDDVVDIEDVHSIGKKFLYRYTWPGQLDCSEYAVAETEEQAYLNIIEELEPLTW